jgi:sporulation integral membrane protein YlbJ
MINQPRVVYQGATTGLITWWEIVFPSLLPFFIASEILMKLGLVRFMGVLLEPVMRPLFNVPGAGGFVMVIGFTSGFPIGSMVTAQLRKQGLCTRVEAERLMSFTNNSSPLFMLTAVAVGMFKQPELGIVIAGAHYLANICLGFCLRFYGRNDREYSCAVHGQEWSLKQAFHALLEHQRRESPALGKLLGEAVSSSVNKLINIGGFIILFAVIIRLFNEAGIIDLIASGIGLLLVPLGFSPEILNALASGFFEMTIGTKIASEAATTQLQSLMAVGMILGWSGLSIHAQVASMIAGTDISMKPFIFSRIAHALLAACFTWLFYRPATVSGAAALPVVAPLINSCNCSTPAVIAVYLSVMVLLLLMLVLISLIIQLFLMALRLVSRVF